MPSRGNLVPPAVPCLLANKPTAFTLVYHPRLGERHFNLGFGEGWITERKWRRIIISDEQARKLMQEISNAAKE